MDEDEKKAFEQNVFHRLQVRIIIGVPVVLGLFFTFAQILKGEKGAPGVSPSATKIVEILRNDREFLSEMANVYSQPEKSLNAKEVATILKNDNALLSSLKGKDGISPTPSEVADVLVRNYGDALRGLTGAAGPQGGPGASPSINYEEIISEVLIRLRQSGETPDAQVKEAKQIYGSGDCFEYDPLDGTRKATLAHGGAICVATIPEVAIIYTNGCSYISFGGRGENSSRDNVKVGETYTFSGNGTKISLVLGCRKESKRFVYPVRLYPAEKSL